MGSLQKRIVCLLLRNLLLDFEDIGALIFLNKEI